MIFGSVKFSFTCFSLIPQEPGTNPVRGRATPGVEWDNLWVPPLYHIPVFLKESGRGVPPHCIFFFKE